MKPKNLKNYIEEHAGDFERVENTGYTDKQGAGRSSLSMCIPGQARIVVCKDCGGALKPKTMRIEAKNGCAHVVNGLEKPVRWRKGA